MVVKCRGMAKRIAEEKERKKRGYRKKKAVEKRARRAAERKNEQASMLKFKIDNPLSHRLSHVSHVASICKVVLPRGKMRLECQ